MVRKILLLIFSLVIFLLGLSFIYSGLVSTRKMMKIEAQLLSKRVIVRQGTRNVSYALAFNINNPKKNIAIEYATETEAHQDSTFYKTNEGEIYTFYLNPAFSAKNEVYRIEQKGRLIFKKSTAFHLFVGVLMSVGGLIAAIIISQTLKRKNSR